MSPPVRPACRLLKELERPVVWIALQAAFPESTYLERSSLVVFLLFPAGFVGIIDPISAYSANFIACASVFAAAAFLWTTFRLPLKASLSLLRRRQPETGPTLRCPECGSSVASL